MNNNDRSLTAFNRTKNVGPVLLCVACTLINILGSYIIHATNSPLFLDGIGTVLSAALGGYLPGAIVGLATSLISGLFDASAIYYGIVNIAIALFTAYFAHKGYFKKFYMIIPFILWLIVIGLGHGTILLWLLDGRVNSFGSYFSYAYFKEVYIFDFIDKAITAVVAYAAFNLMPAKIKDKLHIFAWKQTALSEEAKMETRKSKCRRISLRTKIVLLISVAVMIISVSATVITVVLYKNNTINDNKNISVGVAKFAANIIDPDMVDEYIEKGEEAKGYVETEKLLYNLKKNTPNVEYVYVYKIMEDGCHVVFDLDTAEVKGSDPGDVIPFDESFSEFIPSLLKGEPIEPIISDDSYGWLLTAYEPVYNFRDECVCYAAADVSMSLLKTDQNSFMAKMLSLFAGFFMCVFVIGIYLAEYDIIIPINSMALCASEFAYNTDEARDKNIERIRNLNIFTGDEIENLYNAFRSTTEESMRYVTDIKNKTETISQMQNGLIMVLADMVESRDQCTGDHIRKTAAYTKIIMDGLRKKGYYSDQLTDEFISDVINSAPLHDIGKIHVSDVILNKPGRLTDEEFEIMKYHTTAGSEIISKAIDIVPESGYLNEAKNLAEYHHEKWNGQGYPNGLSGEDIPLSARIMAVADVFDALVSRRSYKEPFTFEKAMDIIRESSGSHFDPKIVEAFVDSENEVRAVELSFEEK